MTVIMENALAKSKKKLHCWMPNIFEFKGGIQTYSAFFLSALQNLYPDNDYQVFLKHDSQSSAKLSFSKNTKFNFYGRVPPHLRTPIFATEIVRQGIWQSPDLVIATHINFTQAAYWLKRFKGIPYWGVVHGVDAWNIERPALKTALKHAEKIISVSNYTRDRLLKEQNLDPAKVLILPNTFDASQFQIGPKPQYLMNRYGLTSANSIILTVARLDKKERYKGYDTIIQGLPAIRHQIPDVHYILVGQGSDRDRIEQLVTHLGLQDCVTFTGFIPDRELGDHYNLCDVFAMPSKGEGFGIVYLEALACGKPTLGANQDGAIDALAHGELGALVDPDNIEEIAQTIKQILQGNYPNPLLYQPEALRQKVIDRFGFERFQQTLADYLNELTI